MKFKSYIFTILFIVDIVFIIISQILSYYGEIDSLSDRDFVGNFMSLASYTNFTDGQEEKIINELKNKMEWKQPQENMDRMAIFFHVLLDMTIIPHIIFFLLLIIYKTKYKSSKCFIIFIDFTSFISLVLPIVYSFIFTRIVIKPINLT